MMLLLEIPGKVHCTNKTTLLGAAYMVPQGVHDPQPPSSEAFRPLIAACLAILICAAPFRAPHSLPAAVNILIVNRHAHDCLTWEASELMAARGEWPARLSGRSHIKAGEERK